MNDISYKHLICENDSERRLLNDILTKISKSEEGQKLIQDAEKYGTQIRLASGMRSKGSFNEETKVILLSASLSDNAKVATLSHELRHSQQFMNGFELDPLKDTPTSYIKKQTLIEADANMAAFVVAWQLKQNNIPEVWDELSKEPSKPFQKFKELAEQENKVTPVTIVKSFREWFKEYSTRDAYDKNYVAMVKQKTQKNVKWNKEECFYRGADMQKEANQVCNFGGVPYFTKADSFFKRPMMNTMCYSAFESSYCYFYQANKWDLLSDSKDNMSKSYGLKIRPNYTYVSDYIKEEKSNLLKSRSERFAEEKQKRAEKDASALALKALKNQGRN